MRLLDWWPSNTALTFARPWLLLLLLAIPLLAYLRGKRGAAAALTFSSTSTLRTIGKQGAARVGKILRAMIFASLAIFIIGLARPQLGKSLTQVEASGIDTAIFNCPLPLRRSQPPFSDCGIDPGGSGFPGLRRPHLVQLGGYLEHHRMPGHHPSDLRFLMCRPRRLVG